MFTSVSFLRLSCDSNRSWTRCMSTTRRATGDPRKLLLEVPRKSMNLSAMKRKVEDKYENRQTPAEFLAHREAMKKQFPEGWNPPRKLTRETMEGLRTLHRHDPKAFSTPVLAERFCISPEAVRRILKSKWMPNKEEKSKLLVKERRRKQEYIANRIEGERADKWEQLDSHQKSEEPKREKKDELTLV